jgi:hexosaminidase
MNKQWMGYEGNDFEVTVDLGEVKSITMLGIDVLQLPVSWIFLPEKVEFYSSVDGKTFTLLNTYYPAETDDIRLDGPVMLARNFDNLRTQFIRIKATNIGVCPPTHPGEGQKAWLFVSEIEIE